MKAAHIFLIAALTAVCSCEKPLIENDSTTAANELPNLTLSVRGFRIVPFDVTRSETTIGDYCTKLNFVVYQEGKKLKSVNQQSTDSSFGRVTLSVEPGTYQVLVLAHSAKNNPVLSDAKKIQFTNDDGYTDTFYNYETVVVGETATEREMELDRCTAMFRFITTDNVPANVQRIRFYYTGGSGALDATTGLGCVNSKQVSFFDVTDDMRDKPLRLETYTIPKTSSSTLKVTVSAYNESNTVTHELELASVPIEMNRITEYTGAFFDRSSSDNGSDNGNNNNDTPYYSIRLNTEWGGILSGTF